MGGVGKCIQLLIACLLKFYRLSFSSTLSKVQSELIPHSFLKKNIKFLWGCDKTGSDANFDCKSVLMRMSRRERVCVKNERSWDKSKKSRMRKVKFRPPKIERPKPFDGKNKKAKSRKSSYFDRTLHVIVFSAKPVWPLFENDVTLTSN